MMRPPPFLPLRGAAAALVCAAATASPAQQPEAAPGATASHRPVLPLTPADLLLLLPPTPEHWQLKQSQASNFFMEWFYSQAQREFNYTPPTPPGAPSSQPPPTQILRVRIVDTGYDAGLAGDFDGFEVAKTAGGESLILEGFPARRTPLGSDGERLRVLVKNRYIIEIDARNQPANVAQRWLRIIDLPRIASLPEGGDEKLPRPIPIIRIDELNPRNNSQSLANWSSREETDAASRRH